MAKRWRWLIAVVVVLLLLAAAYDRVGHMYWVGFTDLEVVYLVTDTETGTPIPDATVYVHSVGGLYAEEDKQRDAAPFELRTAADGTARRVCHRSMTSGAESGLRVTNTYSASLPEWLYQVAASGYQTTGIIYLGERGNRPVPERTGDGTARVVIRVPLNRRGP